MIDWLIDFNGMWTYLGLFYVLNVKKETRRRQKSQRERERERERERLSYLLIMVTILVLNKKNNKKATVNYGEEIDF